MRYGSLCSGIEAASVAWKPLGWKPQFFSEIEAFPNAVLKHHHPEVPNHGDMTKFQEWPDHAIDLLVGGTPCQSFSVAGLRAGLADPRGNLTLTYLAVAARYRPRWVVWENVPGVFSSLSHDAPDPCPPPNPVDMERDGQEVGTVDEYDADETHAFGTFLAGLSELGYGIAYRTLDAQFCRASGIAGAVPQRRRRVFVVGYLGDWRRAAAVLFDAASLRGDSPPRREAGKGVAPTISSRPTGGGGLETDFDLDGGLIGSSGSVAHCLNAGAMGRIAEGFDASEDGTGRGTPLVPEIARTLTRGAESAGKGGYAGRRQEDDSNIIAFHGTQDPNVSGDVTHPLGRNQGQEVAVAYGIRSDASRDGEAQTPSADADGRVRLRNPGMGISEGIAPTVDAAQPHAVAFQERGRDGGRSLEIGGDVAFALTSPNGGGRAQERNIAVGWAVRRLTPVECCRLQGFPDDYLSSVPYRGGAPADGPMYKALGNSMAVNCMRILGQRIAMVDADG